MKTAIYVRVSSASQEEDGTSLVTQEGRCRTYASEQFYEVDESHVYREVHTGTELWERPQLTRLREAVRRREVGVVIAYAIDRLSRDPVHLGVVLSEADHAGVRVEFVTEPLDNSSEGQLIRFIRGYAAKIEHEKIRERSLRGKLARVQSGRLLPSGKPLYGYRWRDSTRSALDIDPLTGPVVQRIFREAVSTKTLRSIAADLTADGIPTPTGKAIWCIQTICCILHHPNYTGEARGWWGGQASSRGRFTTATDRAVKLPEGVVPPLTDRQTFEAVQDRLKRNKQQAPRNNRAPQETLLRGGYVRCGYCDHSVTVSRLRGDKGIYMCSRPRRAKSDRPVCGQGIRAHILDAAVWQRIEALLTRPEIVAAENYSGFGAKTRPRGTWRP